MPHLFQSTRRYLHGLGLGVVVAAAMGSGGSASAALLAHDPFLMGGNLALGQYTDGQDIRSKNTVVTGFAATGYAGTTANFQGSNTALATAAAIDEAGGSMKWLGVTSTTPFDRNVTRQLPSAVAATSSNQWWFSSIVSRTATGWGIAGQTYVVGGVTAADGNGLQIGFDNTAQDANPDLVLRLNGVNTVLAANIAANSSQYVVIGLQVNTSGNDLISVWINPASLTAATPADLTISTLNITDSLTPFTQSKYQSPAISGEAFFDEFRLGTTATAVTGVALLIPEPASLALLGLGGLCLLAGRRQHR